jgi:hypothetical protein
MDAHTCQHCDAIVIDAAYSGGSTRVDVRSTISFDMEAVEFALRDECTFFQWAAAIDPDDIPQHFDEHIVNLPGMVENDFSSEVESSSQEGSQETVNSNEEQSESSEEDTVEESAEPEPGMNGSSTAPLRSLKLHFEAVNMVPRRHLLMRDMARSDAPRPRSSIYWTGPQLEFVAPRGALRTV